MINVEDIILIRMSREGKEIGFYEFKDKYPQLNRKKYPLIGLAFNLELKREVANPMFPTHKHLKENLATYINRADAKYILKKEGPLYLGYLLGERLDFSHEIKRSDEDSIQKGYFETVACTFHRLYPINHLS